MNTFLKNAENILLSASQEDGSEQLFGYLDIPSAITSTVDAIRFLYRQYYENRINGVHERFQKNEYGEEFLRDIEMRISSFRKQVAEEDPYPLSSRNQREISNMGTQLQYRQRGRGLKRRGTR